jgi:hypothetical protein
MTTAIWIALSVIALWGAYTQFMDAWLFYQARKRRREEVRARLFRLVASNDWDQ